MTYRLTCHTDSQRTVCSIYLSLLRLSSIAIELKVDGQRVLILGVTLLWRMFWKNGKRENDETFTLNAWRNGQHKCARHLKILILGEYWHDVENMILSKFWVVYINFMSNVLSTDGSSCQMPRKPFANFFNAVLVVIKLFYQNVCNGNGNEEFSMQW